MKHYNLFRVKRGPYSRVRCNQKYILYVLVDLLVLRMLPFQDVIKSAYRRKDCDIHGSPLCGLVDECPTLRCWIYTFSGRRLVTKYLKSLKSVLSTHIEYYSYLWRNIWFEIRAAQDLLPRITTVCYNLTDYNFR